MKGHQVPNTIVPPRRYLSNAMSNQKGPTERPKNKGREAMVAYRDVCLYWLSLLLVFLVICCLIFYYTSSARFGSTTKDKDPHLVWTVSWNAPFLSGNGYGSEALATVVGLNATLPKDRWSIAIGQHGDSFNQDYVMSLPKELLHFLNAANSLQYDLKMQPLAEEESWLSPERTIVVCHSEPGAWWVPRPLYETEACPPPLAGKNGHWGYRVGRTMFETDRLPNGWADRLNQLDEIWVPTQFHKTIFEAARVKNVRVVGQGIDSTRWDPDKTKPIPSWRRIDPRAQCQEDDVKFLSVFKWEKRKGHDILIPAFWESFYQQPTADDGDDTERKPGACLIIVTSLYHADPEQVLGDMERYWEDATGQKEIDYEDTKGVLLLSGLSEDQLISLYKTADAFVLPSRGEGWGRPYMEAMSMGLPVVATNWSGPTAFLTEENGYFLPIKGLVDAQLEAFPGHQWANPDKEALKELLVRIRDNPEEGRSKGKRARQDILERWSHEKIAMSVARELERIASFVRDGGVAPSTQEKLAHMTKVEL